jgi:hypothetical protein
MHLNQSLNDVCMQNPMGLSESLRADLYRHTTDTFEYKTYLNVITVKKCRVALPLSLLRTVSHRLHIESGRWNKPIATTKNEGIYIVCNDIGD